METREIDISQYWPPVVRNTEEFQQIATALNPEFNAVQAAIYRILEDCFIKEATEYGISRWEAILNLKVTDGMTLDDRRAQILTYLSTKTPYTWRVLEQMLANLLGEDNFRLSFNNETQVLTIAFASTVTDAQMSNVDELCQRVVPKNLVVEVDQGLPIDYTPVKYLESTGTQYIYTAVDERVRAVIDIHALSVIAGGHSWGIGGFVENSRGSVWYFDNEKTSVYLYAANGIHNLQAGRMEVTHYMGVAISGVADRIGLSAQGKTYVVGNNRPEEEHPNGYRLFCSRSKERLFRATFYNVNEELICKCIPALDATGTPCMYDLVTKKPFYNSGTGDFIYPTDAAPAVSADLDEKFYAKLTEHGIRRLYHVPTGCTMSKDEYAARNGFKELVEPPMPQEGYWTPEWRETNTQLICDWIETEPPTEVTENE